VIKTALLLSFFFAFQLSFSQAPTENSNSKNNKNQNSTASEKKLILSMKGYSLKTFESLKDELGGWKEKVKFTEINEATSEFSLIHFSTLDNRELFDILNKYNIDKNSIISYTSN
jgi:hypothetical protein